MDDEYDQGLSGGAGFVLGMMAADSAAKRNAFFRRAFERQQPREEVFDGQWVRETIAGWQRRVAQLEANSASLGQNLAEWKRYAAALEAERNQLQAEVAAAQQKGAELSQALHDSEVQAGRDEIRLQLEAGRYAAEARRLRAELAKLRGDEA